jgi:translation initiation factor 2 gamma subunit (eIF-2gamma)
LTPEAIHCAYVISYIRIFTIPSHHVSNLQGTVFTGTVLAGSISVNDTIEIPSMKVGV